MSKSTKGREFKVSSEMEIAQAWSQMAAGI